MKVLEVYKDIHPFTRGGIERYIHDLSVYLAGSGHQVEVLVAGDATAPRQMEEPGFNITTTPCICRILSNPICPGFTHVLRERPADIVHFHVPLPSAVLSWLMTGRKSPYIVTYHSDIIRQAIFLPVYGPFLRKFLKGAERVLATSNAYAETSRFLSNLTNVTVIPIGVDLQRFIPSESENERDYHLFVGRFRKYKGIQVLLDTWKRFPEKKLIMVGGGPLRQVILEEKDKFGLNIEIVSDPDDASLVRLYQNARSLILPSTMRSEAFGMVQTEAMACGTPVISTSIGTGVSWVNSDGVSGLVVEPDDPVALAAAVEELEDPPVHRRLAGGALDRVRSMFDAPVLFSRIESLMTDIVDRS